MVAAGSQIPVVGHRPIARFMLAAGGLMAIALGGCGDPSGPGKATDVAARASVPPPKPSPVAHSPVELLFPYGSEKERWIDAVTAVFNEENYRTRSGRVIQVRAVAMGSGEMIAGILDGRVRAHLASPASAVFVELGNAESLSRTGKSLLGSTQNLVVSPVVIAMWRPMAEALGWGKKPLGWAEILDLVRSDQGWAKYGLPQWGSFKFGHTHPQYSNSGIISLVAEAYAGVGKTKGLTLNDVSRLQTSKFLHDIESAVVHYGSSTGFFGRKMFANGPGYLSAAVLYENMVIEARDLPHKLPFPVVAIYPKEGTFWSDHPAGIVQREWVGAEEREAAELYVKYLTAEPQQRRAMEFGFRPADPAVPLASPIDRDHGIDPDEPQTTLAVPPAPVIKALLDLWRKEKKHANVVLAIDTSGSMLGDELAAAQAGANEMLAMLGDEDRVSLLAFADKAKWIGQGMYLKTNRQASSEAVASLHADGRTAIYDAVAEAYRYLTEELVTPDSINAIVVLSDGADTTSERKLANLIEVLRRPTKGASVRVFAIGYGKLANHTVLREIAEATRAEAFEGTQENVREVFKKISTFF